MQYTHQLQQNLTTQRTHSWRLGATLSLAVLLLAATGTAYGEAVVLKEGGSTILRFQRMHRVAVVDPSVADVVVSSLDELLLYGKQAGKTKVYVWDRQGRHELAVVVTPAQQAQQLAARLRRLLGPQFHYEVIDSGTLLIDGQVPNSGELERINRVIEGLAEQVEVVNLVTVEGAGLSPSQRRAWGLRELLGDKFTYVAWDDTTLLVMGEAESQVEAQRASKILAAAENGVQINNLITVGPVTAASPVEEIAATIGWPYQVWGLKGRTVVVEGEAPDQTAKQRVDSLLAAFREDADVINLVTVSDQPRVPLFAQRDLLQAALGNHLQVKVIEGKALVVEGAVADEEEAKHVEKLISLFEPDTKIVNLTSAADPRKRQVLVRAKVVEINRGALDRMGINWGQIEEDESFRSQPFVVQIENARRTGVDPVGLQIEALATRDLAKILSEPNLLVDDGETAEMVVGGEVPIPVPQVQAGVATVTIQYKLYGVVLKITPEILSEDRIRLQVSPEVSSIDLATQVAIGGINVPAFRTRKAQTTVTVDNGTPLIIGALVQHEQSRVVRKIPILSSIPIIGQLFKHKEFKEGKTELIIVVTPYIMPGGPEGVPGATEPEITAN